MSYEINQCLEINAKQIRDICDKLRPNQQHEWKQIVENVEGDRVLSLKIAIGEAVDFALQSERAIMPDERSSLMAQAVSVLEDRILNNDLFDVYKRS